VQDANPRVVVIFFDYTPVCEEYKASYGVMNERFFFWSLSPSL
jgi:hypothetical protein